MTGSATSDTPSVMFLSVDMVRSKQLKTAYIRRQESWLPLFRDLFETFPLILVGKVGLRFVDEEQIPQYRVWKTLGDEIVFSTLEGDDKARALLLGAFHDAVTEFDSRNQTMGGYGVKGCAWNVVLGGMNETIAIPEMASADGAGYEDVIGPDVDFGFVLAKHGRDGHTIIDADLARVVDGCDPEIDLCAIVHNSFDTPFRLEALAQTFRLAPRGEP
jgi:hypothetical protein